MELLSTILKAASRVIRVGEFRVLHDPAVLRFASSGSRVTRIGLQRRLETTDYTEYTDKKGVTKDDSLTLRANARNLVTNSLSVFISAICGSIFFSRVSEFRLLRDACW